MTAMPKPVYSAPKQKVPPFARFKGTSVWRKYKLRAHEYALYKAAQAVTAQAIAAQHRASPAK